ncbi:thermonuclease family protein [Bhargavaea ullalensis]|uniref:thermonuclease family protein n=1 Tax=Bhargavaea ullalensis TaxID=1265685 RepID=UPI0035F08076
MNKKLKTKTKVAPVLLAAGLLLSLGGCVSAIAGNSDESAADQSQKADQEQQDTVAEKPQSETSIEKQPEEQKSEKPAKEAPGNPATEEAEPVATAPPSTADKSISDDAPAATPGTTDLIPVQLVRTVDGDTIKIRYNGQEESVRYLLIDTPETSHPRLGKQPFGEQAKERNRELINSGNLSIEFDVGSRTDKYGRLLAYVYVDGKSVEETLLREGLARVAYVYPPNTRHLDDYEKAEAEAKAKKIGIWSIEDYATDSGFDAGAVQPDANAPQGNGNAAAGNTRSSGSQAAPATPAAPAASSNGGTTEWFQNCTELRKKYPNGVPAGHPAYQPKMDRDKDNYACER